MTRDDLLWLSGMVWLALGMTHGRLTVVLGGTAQLAIVAYRRSKRRDR